MNDIIIAAYDYTLPDSGGRISSAVLQKFKVNDFDEGSYEAGKELELRFQIRFMRRIDDFILLCSTDSNPGQIYRISCKSGSLTLCQPNIPDILHQGKKSMRKTRRRRFSVRFPDFSSYSPVLFRRAAERGRRFLSVG